METRRSA